MKLETGCKGSIRSGERAGGRTVSLGPACVCSPCGASDSCSSVLSLVGRGDHPCPKEDLKSPRAGGPRKGLSGGGGGEDNAKSGGGTRAHNSDHAWPSLEQGHVRSELRTRRLSLLMVQEPRADLTQPASTDVPQAWSHRVPGAASLGTT